MEQIIGLVGPSGVGKGYAKEAIKTAFPDSFVEPVVATTRPQRQTDGPDRLAGLSLEDFSSMVQRDEVIFNHQPFGPKGDWYGFLAQSLESTEKRILTEVHIDNILPFKERFGDSVVLVGVVASDEYLNSNLLSRASESKELRSIRVKAAHDERERIQKLHSEGLVDELLEVNIQNRDLFGDLIIKIISKYLKNGN
jgi:guanylate kinase